MKKEIKKTHNMLKKKNGVFELSATREDLVVVANMINVLTNKVNELTEVVNELQKDK